MASYFLDNLEMFRGEQAVWTFTIDTDLTGATIYFAAYGTYPAASVVSDAGALISKTTASGIVISSSSASSSVFVLTISSADTNTFSLGSDPTNFVYGLEYQPSGQTYRVPIGRGTLVIYYDVSRA